MKPSTKKFILILIASVAGILLLIGLGIFIFLNTQFNVYEDARYKFSIKYPKTWKVVVRPNSTAAVAFLRPKDTALDILQENFSVTIQSMPDTVYSLAEFSDAIKRQMTGMFEKSINIIEYHPIHWGWRSGYKMVFRAPKPDHLWMSNAWLLRQDQAYIMAFLGDLNRYKQDSLIVNEMINSFRLK
ncbi:MAG: hypothetical protein HQL13_01975 [Candidatus Omnitrophica bacterium]|nr:hypothetical protein [Candidatus Omnitrophota bacterium]